MRSSGRRFEVFDSNRRFVVVRDDEGYGIWRLDDLEEGEPIERFTDDDDGYERAAERWKQLTRADRRGHERLLPRIKWVVLVSAVVWALAGAVSAILFFQVSNLGQRGFFETLARWAQITTFAAQPLTIGGTAVYVVLWLEGRRDR